MTSPDLDIPRAAYGLAFRLAVVGGYVDAVGFLTLAGLFVAHMSGNTVRLGIFVGDGDRSLAAQRLVPIIVFTIGVAAGIALVEALRRRSAPAPAAMGWQNAALRRVAGVPVHTTFVSGILTHHAEESVNGWYASRDLRRAGTPRRPDDGVAVHSGALACIVASGTALAGGVLGAFLAFRWDLGSLTLPLAVLGGLIVVDVARRA